MADQITKQGLTSTSQLIDEKVALALLALGVAVFETGAHGVLKIFLGRIGKKSSVCVEKIVAAMVPRYSHGMEFSRKSETRKTIFVAWGVVEQTKSRPCRAARI